MFWLIYFICVGLGSLMLYLMRFSKADESIVHYSNEYHDTEFTPYVTILICSHNEANNLEKNLPFVLNQKYKAFEVLIVNHDSTDATVDVLSQLTQKCSFLRVINITKGDNEFKGKKQALYEGYKQAKGDIVLLTDADCKPNSDKWLWCMIQPFKDRSVELVAGYAPYVKSSGLLANLIQLETIETFTSMVRMAMLGFPYMAVGRNMAIRKSTILPDYWNKYKELPFGDDDLMVQTYANKENYRLVLNKEAFVYSIGEVSFGNWLRQKRRHLTTGNYYKPHLIRLLAITPIARLFLLIAFLLVLSCVFKNIILICLSIPVVWLYWIQYLNTNENVRNGVGFVKFFWMHQFLVIYYLVFPSLVLIYKKTNWQRNIPYR